MRHGRHLIAAALAGPLALSLVAAATSTTTPRGTASTTLSAVELAITSPLGDGALGLVDASTFASTATDTAVNAAGGPFASALLTPLTGPAGPVGRTEARSDGTTSVDVAGVSLADIGGPVADLAGTVAPATLSATATATEAHAVIGALTAEIAGLADALGVTVVASDVASRVTATEATATQGLEVSELGVTLGDVIPQDVLASLPLTDLLALLESLPIDLPADVEGLIDDLRTAITAVGDQLEDIAGTEASLNTSLGGLAELVAALNALRDLADVADELALLDDTDPVGTVGDTVDTIGDGVGDTVGGVGSIVGLGAGPGMTAFATTDDCSASTTVAELEACIAALEAEILTATGVGSTAELEALIAELVAEIEALVDLLVAQIDALGPLLAEITRLAAGLQDLLAGLTDLLADAAGVPLVGVSAFDIGVNSLSDGTVDGSKASVGCEPVTVTILGESLTTPGCDQGLAAVRDTAALVSGLLDELTETLNVLPLTEVVTTGDLRVDLFADLQESVVEQGGEVVATAGVTALDLEIPSVTIDPGAVTDLLDQLGLPDVLGIVEGVLGDTLAAVEALALPALGTVTTTLTTTSAELDDTGGLADLVAQLEALLAGLDLGDLGTLDTISTPSIALVIDPVSTATFAVAAPADPAGTPDPAPAPEPALPATGGGLAVLGLATLAGAISLRRRG
ncbi:MAG: hypothetical protein KY461_06415 [Actinobacteria bacterium]|nr:hypothetical protein [Actinomycetota bacterium]